VTKKIKTSIYSTLLTHAKSSAALIVFNNCESRSQMKNAARVGINYRRTMLQKLKKGDLIRMM